MAPAQPFLRAAINIVSKLFHFIFFLLGSYLFYEMKCQKYININKLNAKVNEMIPLLHQQVDVFWRGVSEH